MKSHNWTSENIKKFRKELRLNQNQFAILLGVDTRSVNRWESGNSIIGSSAFCIISGINEFLIKNPDSKEKVINFINRCVSIGGLSYMILSLLDICTGKCDN